MKRSTLEKYQWFAHCGRGQTGLIGWEISEAGSPALECFHALESCGRRRPTREPERLGELLNGKVVHGAVTKLRAEDIVAGMLRLEELADLPQWVREETLQAARKHARQSIGFVPKFLQSAA